MRIVVARFSESLAWMLDIPGHIEVIVYNKGDMIEDPEVVARCSCIESRRNFGREAETYLHHLSSKVAGDGADFTVFCQGDPFAHSPDFLKLLDCRDEWQDVQPLTLRWLESHQIPPDLTLANEQEEYIRGLRVRSEIFSTHTWRPVRFHDEGALRVGRDYLSGQQLPLGSNIAAHFLASLGLEDLAEEAAAADFGKSSHGAIFAVRNDRLSRLPPEVLAKAMIKSRSHPVFGYIFERMWLHFWPSARFADVNEG